jgi:hypothetical protein
VTGDRSSSADGSDEIARIDSTRAHPARIYDYLLGGKDHFAVDRETAQQAFGGVYPSGVETAMGDVRANRAFLRRAVRHLVVEAGIRQFLDIGTGVPTAGNVHEVAQQAAPECRVVYVDNDPVVLAHAHELLQSAAEGVTSYVHGDLRDPASILAKATDTLDLTQPVALMLVGVLHFVDHDQDPYGIVGRLVDVVPAGSHLVISHLANDIQPAQMAEAKRRLDERPVSETFALRDRGQVTRFFDGLDLLEPGVVRVDEWRPPASPGNPSSGWVPPIHCGIGRKHE